MATITLKYDSKNHLIKSIINSAILAGAKVEDKPKINAIDESLKDIKAGRVYRAKSVKDLMQKI
jgi:hypothetical protein